MQRPDFSEHVVHFTKDGNPHSEDRDQELHLISKMTAKERLLSILDQEKIKATDKRGLNLKEDKTQDFQLCFSFW